jgi:hypothetical protein
MAAMRGGRPRPTVPRLRKRADPVAGAFVGTILFAAFLATPVLIVAAILWIAARARQGTPPTEGDTEPNWS